MPVWSISKYTTSLLLVLCSIATKAQEADTTAPKRTAPEFHPGKQLRLSVDVSKPVSNIFIKSRENYELAIDYYLKKEVYAVVEGAYGTATNNITGLNYTSNSASIKIGVDKCLLQRLFTHDWDEAFIGARYGLGFIKRNTATYETMDSLFGGTTGTIEGRNFTAHWAEITGGIRVELFNRCMVGWTVRAKFLLNAGAFNDLAPSYITGYGKGDKSTAFDFNFYFCYVLRWGSDKIKTSTAKGGHE